MLLRSLSLFLLLCVYLCLSGGDVSLPTGCQTIKLSGRPYSRKVDHSTSALIIYMWLAGKHLWCSETRYHFKVTHPMPFISGHLTLFLRY